MLYEFKCSAAGSVIMTEAVAHSMFAILGKQPAAQGILIEAQLPAAIHALRTAVDRARTQTDSPPEDPPSSEQPPADAPVRLAQRAWPLIELLEDALQARQPVTWGV